MFTAKGQIRKHWSYYVSVGQSKCSTEIGTDNQPLIREQYGRHAEATSDRILSGH